MPLFLWTNLQRRRGEFQILRQFFFRQTLMAFLRRALILCQQSRTLNSLSSLNRNSVGSHSWFSSGSDPIEINISDEESTRRLRNKLLYRSINRGFLELDLILGKWVEENLRFMDAGRIRYLVDVLDLENPDLWKWLSGQEQPPDAVNNNPVFSSIQSKVLENLDTYAAPVTRANPGQPWVRGWDDKKGMEGGPKYGNQ